MPSRSDIEHLLRRTEFVARPHRVDELVAKPSLAAAVDDILAVPQSVGSVKFVEREEWKRSIELTHFWLDRMAHDSPRPIQEKMSLFWHGHFCSDFDKVGVAAPLRQQIDSFRSGALSNLRTLARTMSTQVAMLRYLDNNQNKATSPNQNFARELMELFLLGVGNYTEADVEAATAAWTGHTDDPKADTYIWDADSHDASSKRFLGRTINTGSDWTEHGYDTIDVILGGGTVPAGASVVANRGRPTREVAAEFLSTKLWTFFAGTDPSPAVLGALRDAAIAHDFAITPWLRTLLLRSEFYSTEVQQGLVRSPVDFVVACLVATGMRSVDVTPTWHMDGMGQRPLHPPNVAGWKHNAYWVSAGAMSKRTAVAKAFGWGTTRTYFEDGLIRLAGGTVSREMISNTFRDRPAALLDRFLSLMNVSLSPRSYDALLTMAAEGDWWERHHLPFLIMITPDFHVA